MCGCERDEKGHHLVIWCASCMWCLAAIWATISKACSTPVPSFALLLKKKQNKTKQQNTHTQHLSILTQEKTKFDLFLIFFCNFHFWLLVLPCFKIMHSMCLAPRSGVFGQYLQFYISIDQISCDHNHKAKNSYNNTLYALIYICYRMRGWETILSDLSVLLPRTMNGNRSSRDGAACVRNSCCHLLTHITMNIYI